MVKLTKFDSDDDFDYDAPAVEAAADSVNDTQVAQDFEERDSDDSDEPEEVTALSAQDFVPISPAAKTAKNLLTKS